MNAGRYALGVDFGTLSARCVLVDVTNGKEVAWAEQRYEKGVIEEMLPDAGVPLEPGMIRQDPDDYLQALQAVVRQAMGESGISATAIIGIGIDFTSSTILPLSRDGSPLCRSPLFRRNPFAWVHLWKDQSAQAEAATMTARALERDERFLSRYGSTIAADSFFPKVWQISKQAGDVFQAADQFIEAGDWIVQQLTNTSVRGASLAAYKALWDKEFPREYLGELDPNLLLLVQEKMKGRYMKPASRAGGLSAQMAAMLGLQVGTSVATANIDSHAAVVGAGVAEPGKMVIVMGTSACHMVLGESLVPVPGIAGAVMDGTIPGLVGYEAGQPAFGDILAWFAENCVPAKYQEEAERRGITVQAYLGSLAAEKLPGETGLLSLDWWNGNRSPLANGDLSGLILGLTLQSRPEDIYRALMEGAMFGTLEIVRAFTEHYVSVSEIRACGGIAERSSLAMQMLADMTGRTIRLVKSSRTSALGAAVFGAVAAGSDRGGYDNMADAVAPMVSGDVELIHPNEANHRVYIQLYEEYRRLFDLFGRGQMPVMQTLRSLRNQAFRQKESGLLEDASSEGVAS